jgi:hypothetical protein
MGVGEVRVLSSLMLYPYITVLYDFKATIFGVVEGYLSPYELITSGLLVVLQCK